MKHKKLITLLMVIITVMSTTLTAYAADTYHPTVANINAPAESIPDIYDVSKSKYFGYFNGTIDHEGYFGIKVDTSSSKVTVTPYNHSPSIVGETTISWGNSKDDEDTYKSLGTISVTKTYARDEMKSTKSVSIPTPKTNGVYKIVSLWKHQKTGTEFRAYGYFYVNDDEVNTCMKNKYGRSNKAITTPGKLMSGCDPKDMLDLEELVYPSAYADGRYPGVDKWINKSHELIEHDEWSDAVKVLKICDYLSKNFAYDDWQVKSGERRPNYAYRRGDETAFSSGKYDTYNTHIGVCYDFANIMVIMCRAQGIPTGTLERYEDHPYDNGHVIPAVYIDDEWVPIDVTHLVQHRCPTWDTSEENWTRNSSQASRGYGYDILTSEVNDINRTICTIEMLRESDQYL